ncbi:MAG: hypothetical protein IT428_04605 [Planctomycetaceae bacterium]|nr:hypothetical protein [Planctomycetaceae bacterium]
MIAPVDQQTNGHHRQKPERRDDPYHNLGQKVWFAAAEYTEVLRTVQQFGLTFQADIERRPRLQKAMLILLQEQKEAGDRLLRAVFTRMTGGEHE